MFFLNYFLVRFFLKSYSGLHSPLLAAKKIFRLRQSITDTGGGLGQDSRFRGNDIQHSAPWGRVVYSVFVLIAIIAIAAFYPDAAQATTPLMDASCNNMNQYGFTGGLVYCVEASINNAVKVYLAALTTALIPYESMALVVAIALFGFKMMNSNMRDPVKDFMNFTLRVLVGIAFYNQVTILGAGYPSGIYSIIAGAPPTNNGIINQLTDWITGFTASGSASGTGTMFSHLINSNCKFMSNPYTTFGGYQVWQAFDCMFTKIFGAADISAHPEAFTTSMLVIIAAALLSANFGIAITMLGLSVMLTVLLLIFRALYLVLMAYVCVGFMTIFSPLIAPLIFFDNKFLTEKFRNWLGIIISCIFQPVFVVGFLAMAVIVDDQFIEGNLAGCTPPTAMTATSTLASAPAAGYGQDGSGVCSFTQLFNGGLANDDPNLSEKFTDIEEQNAAFFNMGVVSTPQGKQTSSDIYHPTTGAQGAVTSNNGETVRLSLDSGVANQVQVTNMIRAQAANLGVSAARLKSYAPLRQFLLTLFAFIFVTAALYRLLDVIPEMASSMTIAMGVVLTRGIANEASEITGKITESLEGGIRNVTGVSKPADAAKQAPTSVPRRATS